MSTASRNGTHLAPIRIVTAVILDDAGRVLVVRKHGSDTFIQPGGKREPGEDALRTLARELHEELGVTLRLGDTLVLGTFEDDAVNEPGRRVQGESFLVRVDGRPQTQAEIAELAWIPLRPPHGVKLAPLSERHILPAARRVTGLGKPAEAGDSAPHRFPQRTRVIQPAPPPLRPARPAAASFVDVTARLSLVMAGLSIAWSLFQLLLVAVLGRLDPAGWLQQQGLPVPAAMQWAARHALSLTLLMLLLSAAMLAVSWALLRRHEWGRIGFIVFLVVVAAANFAMLPLVDGMFDAMQAILPAGFADAPEGRQALAQMRASRWTALLSAAVTALAFAGLHGWLVVKLCRDEVRALFR